MTIKSIQIYLIIFVPYVAENPVAHRSLNKSSHVSIDEAFGDRDIVCYVWNAFMKTNITIDKFGYKPWKNIQC